MDWIGLDWIIKNGPMSNSDAAPVFTPVNHIITWITTQLPTPEGWKAELVYAVNRICSVVVKAHCICTVPKYISEQSTTVYTSCHITGVWSHAATVQWVRLKPRTCRSGDRRSSQWATEPNRILLLTYLFFAEPRGSTPVET